MRSEVENESKLIKKIQKHYDRQAADVLISAEKWFLHADGAFSSESFVIKVLIIWGIISVIGIAVSNVVFRRRDI